MPKGWGVNAKKEEARADEQAKKGQAKATAEKKKEDDAWRETDAKVLAKEAKRREAEEKERERARLQQEKKALYEQEKEELAAAKARPAKDVKKVLNADKPAPAKPSVEAPQPAANEESGDSADDLAEYLRYVNVVAPEEDVPLDDATLEKHPEKRVAAAWAKFKVARLDVLREAHPGLKLRQYTSRLWKEFTKSADNPLNNPANKDWRARPLPA